MSGKPKSKLRELLKEAELTATSYLIVEGRTDRSFYKEWLRQAGKGQELRPLVVEAVDAIDLGETSDVELQLPKGARSSVILIALAASKKPVDIRCIADRDCGHHVDKVQVEELWWTDFPALESYLFESDTLDTVNRMAFGERLPDGAKLVATLAPVLRELYTVRLHNESLRAPDISKGYGKSKNPVDFDVRKAVAPEVAAVAHTYTRPSEGDPRSYAYGHDIADLLLHQFGNEIKNQAKIPHREALEAHFRWCLLVSKTFDSSVLAAKLSSWLKLDVVA